MLIFSVNSCYEKNSKIAKMFDEIVNFLSKKYSQIVSIFLLENTGKADIVQGNPVLLFGEKFIEEQLFDFMFEVQPRSFFQVNTLCAEKLYQSVVDFIQNKNGILLDLYAGTGTI